VIQLDSTARRPQNKLNKRVSFCLSA